MTGGWRALPFFTSLHAITRYTAGLSRCLFCFAAGLGRILRIEISKLFVHHTRYLGLRRSVDTDRWNTCQVPTPGGCNSTLPSTWHLSRCQTDATRVEQSCRFLSSSKFNQTCGALK
ncbi:hypothetical protein C8F04DRAFT_422573 [Mycena alexandri]|uniref:Uncharacterized protein n=1 Tax=Mycena alexandri TaxID=1745969 RepID=A0AAD6RYH2_9AGAR|nr:hypothetical protein C8F04DRAFT_422573 [Mycena alexandri]